MRNIIFIALLLSACGTQEPERSRSANGVVAVSSFKSYLNIFLDQASQRGVYVDVDSLIVDFSDIHITDKENVLGVCYLSPGSPPVVNIDRVHWRSLGLVERQLLLFHELGHCLLHRDHVEDSTISIMNPYLISAQTFSKNEEGLMSELFDSTKFDTFNP